MNGFKTGMIAVAMTFGMGAYAADAATEIPMDSVISESEVDQNLLAPEALDSQYSLEAEQALADGNLQLNAIHHRPGDGWELRQCAGFGPVQFCWTQVGGNGGRGHDHGGGWDGGRDHRHAMVSCTTTNVRTHRAYRAQAPRGQVSAMTLQARATRTCKMNSVRPASCRAMGCTTTY